jgi:hypothetical protein
VGLTDVDGLPVSLAEKKFKLKSNLKYKLQSSA